MESHPPAVGCFQVLTGAGRHSAHWGFEQTKGLSWFSQGRVPTIEEIAAISAAALTKLHGETTSLRNRYLRRIDAKVTQ